MAEAPMTELLPPEDGDAPFHEVSRDGLSVFLYLAFTDTELGELFKALRLSIPGFRIDKLSGVQKADHLADEIRERPEARASIVKMLRDIYEFPGLDDIALSAPVAERLAVLSEMEDFRILVLWRLLADPQADVRKAAHPTLALLAKAFYGGTEPAPKANAPKPATGPRLDEKDAAREVERARDIAEKAESKAEGLAAQLKEARQTIADTDRELSKARKAAERAHAESVKLKADLERARGRAKGKSSEKQEREAQHLRDQVSTLAAREAELAAALEEAKTSAPVAVESAAPQAEEEEELPLEEAPPGWLLPTYSREFYDSLTGWDVRIQRTAFKQAYLLSENYRHPSLRALPLLGLEGYYRVRVATDVRLIYRRHDDDTIEILSLIDREDLDRYVRQAKARAS